MTTDQRLIVHCHHRAQAHLGHCPFLHVGTKFTTVWWNQALEDVPGVVRSVIWILVR